MVLILAIFTEDKVTEKIFKADENYNFFLSNVDKYSLKASESAGRGLTMPDAAHPREERQ